MTKTILVTGCAGFIGSHLCKYLLEKENCKIIGLDNLSTGKKTNIESLLKKNNFQFIEGDIVEPLLFKEQINEIYNLACPASPTAYQKDAIHTIKTNTIGILNVLELARKNKAKILQSSTSEVYGDPLQNPQNEKYNGNVNPIGPRACYDEGKRLAETLFFEYERKYKIKIRVARIFNTYGPKMDVNDGRVISNFIVQALQAKDITVYGKGSQTRSFCFITDMVIGLHKLMNGGITGPVNLGNPNEKTILQIAKIIIKMTSSKSKIIFKNLPKDDPRQRKPDIALAKKVLRWNPIVSLDNGLKETIKYFQYVL
ncbi:MAG: UDP-glucuronic acid decarboxylase family protein [Patescibacteria group bacterium]